MDSALVHTRNEKINFRRLYNKVLNRLINASGITGAAISAILHSFKRKRRFEKKDLNTRAKICAYLYKYGSHGAGLVRCRVLEALENCARLRPVLDEIHLKVLSVGGGPFNDVIGFLSAMSQVDQRRMDNGQTFYNRKMDIWVSDDTSPLWNYVVKQTARLVTEGEFGYVSDLFYKVRALEFFPGTLPSNLDQYHVVIISKFINSLDHAEQFKLMRDLWSGLTESAFVLVIACPYRDDLWNDLFECLYLSDPGRRYFSGSRVIRFGHHNRVTSVARIAVLRKREQEMVEITGPARQLPADGG